MSNTHGPAGTHDDNEPGLLTRERTLALVLVAATAVVFYLTYRLTLPFLPALTWAVALAVIAHPLHEWIMRRVGKPNIAAGLAVLIVAIGILGPSLLVLQQLFRQAANAAQGLQKFVESEQWRSQLERYPRLADLVQWGEQNGGVAQIREAMTSMTGNATSVVTGTVWGIVQLLIALFALFYFFRDRRAALRWVRHVVPLSNREVSELLHRVADTIYATIYGTVLVALLQGLLGGLMFWWLGLPAPLLWGVIMALLALIPYLGAFVVWAPAAGYLAAQGEWGKAIALTAWGTIVVGLIDNLVYPILVGGRLRMHTLAAFIAIVGGISVFGMSGIVLGPVIVALAIALVEVWRDRTSYGQAAETAVAQ